MTIETEATPAVIGPCINCGEITGADDIVLHGERPVPFFYTYDGTTYEGTKSTRVFIHRERCAERVIDAVSEALMERPVQA